MTSVDPTSTLLLPKFERGNETMTSLFDALWPHGSDGGLIENSSVQGEPPALRRCISSLTPDDLWLGNNDLVEDSMNVDRTSAEDRISSEQEVDQAQSDDSNSDSEVRFIDLQVHPALAIDIMAQEVRRHRHRATFIVRHEYSLFMEHALSVVRHPGYNLPNFFVTGQSGIGLSFMSCYILFYLLASGQPVFYITAPNTVYYFSSDGVQYLNGTLSGVYDKIWKALKDSWVVIDIVDDPEWMPPQIVMYARCVVWTSSPQEPRMRRFTEKFCAQTWFMSAWSKKEIAAATERYEIPRDIIKKRLDTEGPVARNLFTGYHRQAQPCTLEEYIGIVLRNGKLFPSFNLLDAKGDHRVFLIQPLKVLDKASGRVSLQRTDFEAAYRSAYIAHQVFELADSERHLERLWQGHLATALNVSTTRQVAGKLLAAIIHRALTRHDAVTIPAVFGDGQTPSHIAGTVQLIGTATDFVSIPKRSNDRPLYLQPESLDFEAVDGILVTDKKLGLIQTSLGGSNFGMMLQIMARLPRGANVAVNGFEEVLYCLIGLRRESVQAHVAQARMRLQELQKLDSHELSQVLGMKHTEVGHRRLSIFSVVGYIFHYEHGFTLV